MEEKLPILHQPADKVRPFYYNVGKKQHPSFTLLSIVMLLFSSPFLTVFVFIILTLITL